MITENGALQASPSSEDGKLTITTADGTVFHLSEFVRAPQDALASRPWVMQEENGEVVLSAHWGSIWMEKRILLPDDSRSLRLEYTFRNDAPIFVRTAFGLRLWLPTEPGLRWFVPAAESIRENDFRGDMPGPLYLRPSRPWCAVATGDYRIAVLSPDTVQDAVEITSDPTGTALSPLVYYLGLSPGFEACVTFVVDFAAPPPDAMDTWYEARAASLPFSYRRASRGTTGAAEATAMPAAPQPSISPEHRQSLRRLAEVGARLAEDHQKRMSVLEAVARGELSAREAGTLLLQRR